MDNTIAIIQATLDHADQIAPLFDAYRQFYNQEPNLERSRNFVAKRLINRESVIFIALNTATGTAIGFTQLYPSFSSVSMKRLWILNDLFVADGARQQGIAKALLEKARLYASESGAKGLSLETAMDNVVAQKLYEYLGWQRNEEFYTYYINV